MSYQRRPSSKLARAARKYAASTFVIGSFIAYAIHEHALPGDTPSAALVRANTISLSQPTSAAVASLPTQITIVKPTTVPTNAAPTNVPEPTTVPTVEAAQGLYKDGTYTGDVVDAYYGNVQVQAIVRAGKIADVQFLEFPRDRRTSQRINNIATPYLTSEAIQAQSAQVDIISGATLTSEAFVQSLETALQSAKA